MSRLFPFEDVKKKYHIDYKNNKEMTMAKIIDDNFRLFIKRCFKSA